uniref:Uncharacterized protein n=1 Tax=Oryza sativa subsp. japonica TaxID=39947 RepID=Q2QXX6_ORYSJ|nr:hypothetical protein LOC_Os12g04570 [Oryza sativa Japonica Group]
MDMARLEHALPRGDLHRPRVGSKTAERSCSVCLKNFEEDDYIWDQGGLGILDLEIMNCAMLGKWIWRLENERGWWQDILTKKYCHNKVLSGLKVKPGVSHFWQGIMDVKEMFYKFCTKVVGNGRNTLFWEDNWIGGKPLAEQFPDLYNITLTKKITVANVKQGGIDSIKFRRDVLGNKLRNWLKIKQFWGDLVLEDGTKDTLRWSLTKDGKFTVNSFYKALKMQQTRSVWILDEQD